MARYTTLAAALALTATAGLALPATAATMHRHGARARMMSHQAYRAGFNRGVRVGRAEAMRAGPPMAGYGQPYGQAAYAQPGYAQPGYGQYAGPFNNGGVLGTGVLNGQGVLGTGVGSGQGALGIGVLGF